MQLEKKVIIITTKLQILWSVTITPAKYFEAIVAQMLLEKSKNFLKIGFKLQPLFGTV